MTVDKVYAVAETINKKRNLLRHARLSEDEKTITLTSGAVRMSIPTLRVEVVLTPYSLRIGSQYVNGEALKGHFHAIHDILTNPSRTDDITTKFRYDTEEGKVNYASFALLDLAILLKQKPYCFTSSI